MIYWKEKENELMKIRKKIKEFSHSNGDNYEKEKGFKEWENKKRKMRDWGERKKRLLKNQNF